MIESLPQKRVDAPFIYYGRSYAKALADTIGGPILHILPCHKKKYTRHGTCEINGFGSVNPLVVFGSPLNGCNLQMAVLSMGNEIFSAWVNESVLLCSIDFAIGVHHFLSLEHEIDDPVDFLGRPIARKTGLYLDGLAKDPVVERLAEVFTALCCSVAVKADVPLLRKAKWPGQYQFCVPLSHDIDVVRKYTIRGIVRELLSINKVLLHEGKKNAIETIGRMFRALINHNADPYWNLNEVAKLDQSFGAKSSFFFLAGDRDTVLHKHRIVGNYGKRTTAVSSLIPELVKEDFEIGLHGAYISHSKLDVLRKEKNRLQVDCSEPIMGIRQHFLLYDKFVTPHVQKSCKFVYDSSVGYRDFCGYRSGNGCPYSLFETSEQENDNLIEIPIIVMDSALQLETGSEMERATSTLMHLLNECRQGGSCLTLLWHNTSFNQNLTFDLAKLYTTALNFACTHKGWLTSLREVRDWWEQRRKAKVDIQLLRDENTALVNTRKDDRVPVEIFVPSSLFERIKIRSTDGEKLEFMHTGNPRNDWDVGKWLKILP